MCAGACVQRIRLHAWASGSCVALCRRPGLGNCVALPLCPVSVLRWMKLSLGCFLGSLQILMIPGSASRGLGSRTVQHPLELLGFPPEGLSAPGVGLSTVGPYPDRRRGRRTVPEEIDLKGNFSWLKVEPGFLETFLSRPQLQFPRCSSHSCLHLGASHGKPPDPGLTHSLRSGAYSIMHKSSQTTKIWS